MNPGARSPAPRDRGMRRARRKAAVDPARFLSVRLHADPGAPGDAKPRRRRSAWLLALAPVLALSLWTLTRRDAPPASEEVFLFEEQPAPPPPQTPPPDPAPPPPAPPAIPEPAPPPQFGLQQEALSETGDLAVAAGNTLMTEADSVTREPVAALPPVPQLVDQAPRILRGRPPEYPQRALERGVEGSVTVLATIDTLGRVTSVDVEKSGGRDFDPEVVRAVRALVFQPVVREGRRIPVRVRLPYDFRLE